MVINKFDVVVCASRRRHTRLVSDWSSDVCSSDLEHLKEQSVRFNVDVGILRSSHVAEDMRDVFSYDVILDSIRMIVAQEHIALVETLAERIDRKSVV